MRILMLSDFYWPFVGGVEEHVRRLSQGLAGRGHAVSVVTLGNDDLPPAGTDHGVRIYRVRAAVQRAGWLFSNRHRPWAPPLPDPAVLYSLQGILRAERPDVVHGHDWLARAYLPLKPLVRAPFVMSLHYYTLSCAKKSLLRGAKPCSGPAFRKCLRCAASHYGGAKGIGVTLANWAMSALEKAEVDVFLPVSVETAQGNGLSDSDRYEVVPNFMPERTRSGVNLGPFLAQLPAEPFLLYVGDLRRAKGIDVLLTAYAGLTHAPPLVLIGKVWPESPQTYPPNVVVLRDWPNEAVLAAWDRSLMGIVPSIWPEPFGIVVIEAMNSGRPVIASRIGGLPDLLGQGAAGVLVPPGDAGALREALAGLLRDDDRRTKLGQEARRRASLYRASVVIPRIEQIYAGLGRRPREKHEQAAVGEHHYQ